MKKGVARVATGLSRPDAADDGAGPAADPLAPYVRLAVAGLIQRLDGGAPEGRNDRGGPAGCDSGRWLLLRGAAPVETWDPPGGRMERGEDLTSALVRELAEETGLAVRVGGPCYALLIVYKGERLLAVSMACRPLSDPDIVSLEQDGATEWRWASTEEWARLASEGRSSWDPDDIRKAARMATALWEAEKE